ncbi:transforming growth factor-beta receptor-associated protein 1 [Lingula anatina]|uniref:Transforming growth factor-beta receptor-associated protein 1 n=1 Tax=Lingula anatina TaxID=7574 RepID=A0A1S3H2F8_LINAN|nr:transforming growth factor-beta receptor-associated protein 1 [Lingula anatina]|eukprot:XP_013380315.1 transforming growth factor-beta receptor-associated protein 1 [Lingula anatina]
MSVKAFELVPAVERDKFLSKQKIECIDCCGKNLYIGTDSCFVIHYKLEEKTLPNGKTGYESKKLGHKYLGVKKPITQLKAASALTRILVLCDNTLTLLNMLDLEPIMTGAKIKGVTSFCLNENPNRSNPFSIQICVALKKKVVQLYTVTEDRMNHEKDVSISDPALNIGLDGSLICVATTSDYKIVNYETGGSVELFPYDYHETTPLVKRIGKEEFLLSAPNALGLFANATGASPRPPLMWSDSLTAITYHHPYVIAMNDEFITVHSILDQQQKQAVPFKGGRCLDDFDGKLFVATGNDVWALFPVHWEKQVQDLLENKKVEEAIELAQNARNHGLTKEKFQKAFVHILQQAGFVELARANLDQARDYFRDGQLDVRELISIYPNLLPASSNFTRSPSLHKDIADVNQLANHQVDRIKEYKQFLAEYLEEIRETKESIGLKTEIDTALLKLYAENNSPNLVFLLASECACEFSDCVQCLEMHQRQYALGLLYRYHGDHEKALQIWTRIASGELKDGQFPGIDFIIEFLANLSNHELVWKYVDWALERSQEKGVKIFTERPEDEPQTERMRPDTVIDYLHRFPRAVIAYLEYLVFTKKLEKEKYHTHLAVLYLDTVLQMKKNSETPNEALQAARSKLQNMLQVSNLYRIQLILGKVKETDMYEECAILYGKLEEHEKAIRLLVHKLRDYRAAENYCLVNSKGKDQSYRKRLFQILLGVYLDPSYEKRDTLIHPAVSLLNSSEADFDVIKILQLLPENWSVGLLELFLHRATRNSLDRARTRHVERMLSRGENLEVHRRAMEDQRQAVLMNEDRSCAVCTRAFSESTFVRYPNGIITHVHCAKNKYVCPVTGKLFSTNTSSGKDS